MGQKAYFSHASANILAPTRPMCQFWASETLQKHLRDASGTLRQRSTSHLHLLLGMFIRRGRFHGQLARWCGALLNLVRVRVGLAAAVCDH